ncbi:outer-membrane lipoprotein carrier protein LolA [Starkeya sp. ORNL1]|uniref:outer-membrane lipoprotein carrier protein LolA n=1 Tax=Starkeya sp. ORNL1 TaxID=2709380 RepID=UPI001FED4495|nr:outer-membrane lipoprotein carrier protein LolA [Starkeya sp. ORNL1]
MRLVLPAACLVLALSGVTATAQQSGGILLPPGNVPDGAPVAAPVPVPAAPPAPAARPAAAAAPAAPVRLPTEAPLPTPAPLQKDAGAAPTRAPATTAAAAPAASAAPAPAAQAPDPDPTQIAAATGPGGPRAAAATVERINNYFNSFKTMTGTFTQVDPDGSRKKGTFYILKPGRVLFEYNPPSQVVLVADGRSVSVRDKRLKTQDITPLSATPLRFLLSENLDLSRNSNVVGVYQDDVFATVVLEEKQPAVGTYRLMIMFDAKTLQLKQWTVTDPQGYDTTVAVYNLNTAEKPDPMMFVINRDK